MIKVVKGNVVLRVDDSLLDFYVNKGFTAKTLEGKVIKEAIPTDMDSLKKAYLQSKEEIKTLREENKALKEQLGKAQQPIVSDDRLISEDKPRRQRRKSANEE
jgi:regulator of replication initiation timing